MTRMIIANIWLKFVLNLYFAACHLNMTSQSGTFSSPFYPDLYSSEFDCRWQITRPLGHVIRLNIHSFELEYSQSCTKDYVTVYDGWSGNTKILGIFFGDHFPLFLETTSNNLIVVFKSDELGRGSGFRMSYTSHSKCITWSLVQSVCEFWLPFKMAAQTAKGTIWSSNFKLTTFLHLQKS
jgi:hypothetical protein